MTAIRPLGPAVAELVGQPGPPDEVRQRRGRMAQAKAGVRR